MESSGNRVTWGYRPHLDGLRAVAVYLVVAFHSGIARLSGGFIGVDVFFVLSGYLVTGILLRDLEGDGRIRYTRFYARRVRRLLPAAALTLLVTAVVFAAVGGRAQIIEAESGIRAASLYFANWHFIARSADYFAAELETSPVLHFWSLAVEEQFYMFWPLVFGGLYALTRRAGSRHRLALRAVVGVLAAASVVAALRLEGSNLERAYYGTDTRAYQLLAGALLAISPGLVQRARTVRIGPVRASWLWPVASVLVLASLLVLSTSRVGVLPIRRGAVATVLTVVLVVSLEASNGGLGRRLLSLPPVVYLGRISYGTYLWHWLVVVVLLHETDLGSRAIVVVTAAVATGLASLSYQLLEMPIRTTPVLDRLRTPTLVAGFAVSVLVGLVLAPAAIDRRYGASAVEAAQVGGLEQGMIGDAFFDVFDYEACPSSAPEACTLTTGSAGTAMVVGDSHAATYAPMLTNLARRHDLSLYGGLLSYCPWTRGIQYFGVGAECLDDQDRLFEEILPEVDPDIVFLAHRPVDDPHQPMEMFDADVGHVTGKARDERLAARITELVDDLVADGRTVVLFEPAPVAPAELDPFTCLDEEHAVEPCRFVATPGGVPEDRLLEELDEAEDSVVSIDLDQATCPYLPICDPVVNGEVVRRDGNHLTLGYARSLIDVVDERLSDEGVLE